MERSSTRSDLVAFWRIILLKRNDLVQIAKAFRKAFETVGRDQKFGNFPDFPEGCCSWASLFIGNFLIEEYGLRPQKVYSALHHSGDKHEWVLLDGVIIDITADQFDDAPGSVIVELKSQWHATFKDSEIGNYLPVSRYDINDQQNISDIYKKNKSIVRKFLC